MGGNLTAGQIVFIAVFVVLVLNAGVYGMRIQFLLAHTRAESLFRVLFGFAVWQRIISGSCDGLDLASATEFLALRRSFLISMALAAAAVVVGPIFMKV